MTMTNPFARMNNSGPSWIVKPKEQRDNESSRAEIRVELARLQYERRQSQSASDEKSAKTSVVPDK